MRVPLLLVKMPLFLGMDLLAAATLAGVAMGLAGLFRSRLPRVAMMVEGGIILLAGFFIPVSGFVRQVLGTPLDALAIQYLFGGQEASGRLVSEALQDSISMYLTPGRLSLVGGTMILGLVVWWWMRRRGLVPSPRGVVAWVVVVAGSAALSGLLAPALSSGRLLGTRVMTWEQERSEVTDLVASFLRIQWDRWTSARERGPVAFWFEPPLPPLPSSPEPPLGDARPGRHHLVLVVLESVPARALEGRLEGDLPAFRALAEEGVSFAAHYTHWPRPSRVSSLCCAPSSRGPGTARRATCGSGTSARMGFWECSGPTAGARGSSCRGMAASSGSGSSWSASGSRSCTTTRTCPEAKAPGRTPGDWTRRSRSGPSGTS